MVDITLSSLFTDNLLGTGTEGVAVQIGGGVLALMASGAATIPTGPNEAATGSTLTSFTFSTSGSQGTPSAGSMTIAFATTTTTAINSGTANYFRIVNSTAGALIQGTVGTSGADWNLSSNVVTAGDSVSITGTPTISWVVS